MSDRTDWKLYARDAALSLQAQIDDYQFFDAVVRFNDVGTWVLDMDASVKGASILQQDGAGIVLTRDDTTVLSGPVSLRERDFGGDPDRNRLKLKGFSDDVWLSRRLAHPQPATSAPPYNSQAYDVRTGTCSTILRQYVDVNLGPSALGVRQVPGLVLGTDPGIGSSVTGRARWDPLLPFLQSLALVGGDIGFNVQQVGSGLQFNVFQPATRAVAVTFSTDIGNLSAFDWSEEAPRANYVFCGGSGTDTSRIIQEGLDSGSIVRWGRIEEFRDRRDTSVSSELAQTISQELLNNQGAVTFAVSPIDLPQMTYLTHYGLGDVVTAIYDGVSVTNTIREVHITLGQPGGTGGAARIIPMIGTPARNDLLKFFDQIRRVQSRLVTLERV